MGDLGKQMMNYVSPNVVVDLVKDAIVAINGAQPPAQVTPFLTAVPRDLCSGSIELVMTCPVDAPKTQTSTPFRWGLSCRGGASRSPHPATPH